MKFITKIQALGIALVESSDGCTAQQFNAYMDILKFFEYHNLAIMIAANVAVFGGRYKSRAGVLSVLFKDYC